MGVFATVLLGDAAPKEPVVAMQNPMSLGEATPDRWFVAYHAHEPRYDTLGRQMLPSPVEWTDDGWWRVAEGRIPKVTIAPPGLPAVPATMDQSDELETANLGLQWFFLCPPDREGMVWALTARPGFLRVYPPRGGLGSSDALPALLQQRVVDKAFAFETTVEFRARSDGECAGLHLYHDPLMNLWLGSSVRDGLREIEVGKYNLDERTTLWAVWRFAPARRQGLRPIFITCV